MNNYGIICGIVILIIFIFVIVMELRKSSDKKAASNFLQGLADEILTIILETINKVSPKDFNTLNDFYMYAIDEIYSNVWDFVTEKATSDDSIDRLTAAVFKYVDADRMESFINALISNNGIEDKIANQYAAYNIKNFDHVVDEDKKLEEEYADEEQYIEISNDEDLAPTEEKTYTEKEIAAINPQREEEEEFDVDDDSMEIITDKKEIITATSKTGQTLYYEVDVNGNKKRVSKDYALKYLEKKV